MTRKPKRKGLYAMMLGTAVSAGLYAGLLGSSAQACACEGEDPYGSWMQNVASWGFAFFLIGIFVLSMVLFTIVMIRNSRRKPEAKDE